MGGAETNFPLVIGLISGGLTLVIILILLIIFIIKRNKKPIEINDDVIDNNMWVNALGGNDNIVSLEAKGSRLIINVKDNTLIKKEELHDIGVLSVIVSQDKVTLVLKEKAENIKNLLQ